MMVVLHEADYQSASDAYDQAMSKSKLDLNTGILMGSKHNVEKNKKAVSDYKSAQGTAQKEFLKKIKPQMKNAISAYRLFEKIPSGLFSKFIVSFGEENFVAGNRFIRVINEIAKKSDSQLSTELSSFDKELKVFNKLYEAYIGNQYNKNFGRKNSIIYNINAYRLPLNQFVKAVTIECDLSDGALSKIKLKDPNKIMQALNQAKAENGVDRIISDKTIRSILKNNEMGSDSKSQSIAVILASNGYDLESVNDFLIKNQLSAVLLNSDKNVVVNHKA